MRTITGDTGDGVGSLPFAPWARYTSGMGTARPRTRRLLKRSGLVLSLLIGVLWTASCHRTFRLRCGTSYQYHIPISHHVTIMKGSVFFWSEWAWDDPSEWRISIDSHPYLAPPSILERHRGFMGSRRVPLWMPFLIVSIPTGLLWWRDRRGERPGYCSCGYDLTGNTSGICSECGVRI